MWASQTQPLRPWRTQEFLNNNEGGGADTAACILRGWEEKEITLLVCVWVGGGGRDVAIGYCRSEGQKPQEDHRVKAEATVPEQGGARL